MYYDVVDPFVALAMAAEATQRILLGTSICLVVQRDPIQLAKQVASLDALSGGRFQFGVGGGWNPLEIANHGTAFGERLAVMEERIAAMKRIWADDRAEFHGEHVDFAPLYAWPKPAQKPHPPIHVAANAPKGLARVVRQGDGWFPLMQAGNPGSVTDHLPELRRRVADSGRAPDAFEVSVYLCPPDKDVLLAFRDAGVHRVIFLIDPVDREPALRQLDERTELLATCA
jgi:probable F420-dependent oxidoreductase